MLKKVELPFGTKIFQLEEGQSITSDTAELVEIIKANKPQNNLNVLELGSGNGIISIMLAHYFPNWKIIGIEIQNELVELSKKNAKISKQNIHFLQADLKKYCAQQKYDLIVSNPPYYPQKMGKISPNKIRAISRHEILCNMNEIFSNINLNLKKYGKAYLIYPCFRMVDIEKNLKKVDLNIAKKLIINQNKKGEKIIMELVRA